MAGHLSRRTMIKTAFAAGATIPFLRGGTALAQNDDEYITRYVHPDLQSAAQLGAELAKSTSGLTLATLPQFRTRMATYISRPRLTEVAVEKRVIAGAQGLPSVTVFVVNAKPGSSRPAILHTHGGGFVLGEAAGDIASLQALSQTLDCVVVSVEYRLAPETTWAGSVEDNYTGLKWLHANAKELGVDPARIAVMGGSAGGGHAALLAIVARDRGEVPIAFQCLIYPMLDDRTGSTRKVPEHVGRLFWTAEANRFGWRSFLGVEPGDPSVPKGAVPARVANLSRLPPAFIGVGSIDLFHDENVDYAQRLNAAGVPAELIVVPGAYHGFDASPARISQWFNAAKLDALRRGLGIPAA